MYNNFGSSPTLWLHLEISIPLQSEPHHAHCASRKRRRRRAYKLSAVSHQLSAFGLCRPAVHGPWPKHRGHHGMVCGIWANSKTLKADR